MELPGFAGKVAAAVVCKVSGSDKETIGMCAIEIPDSKTWSRYYFMRISSDITVGSYLFSVYRHMGIQPPNPLDSLTWNYDSTSPVLSVRQIIPNVSYAKAILPGMAEAIASGMLPIPDGEFMKREPAEERWTTILNSTINHITGLNHQNGTLH